MTLLIFLPLFITSARVICLPDTPYFDQNRDYYQIQNPDLYQMNSGINSGINGLEMTRNFGMQHGGMCTNGLLYPRSFKQITEMGPAGMDMAEIGLEGIGMKGMGMGTSGMYTSGMNTVGMGMPQEGLYPGLIKEFNDGPIPYTSDNNFYSHGNVLHNGREKIHLLLEKSKAFNHAEKTHNMVLLNPTNILSVNCKPQAPIFANNLYGSNDWFTLQQMYSPQYINYLKKLYECDILNNQHHQQNLNKDILEKMQRAAHDGYRWKQFQHVYSPQYSGYLQNLYGLDFLKNINDQFHNMGILGRLNNVRSRLWHHLFGPRYNINGINNHIKHFKDFLEKINGHNHYSQYPTGYYQWIPYPSLHHNLNNPSTHVSHIIPPSNTIFDRFQADENNTSETRVEENIKPETNKVLTETNNLQVPQAGEQANTDYKNENWNVQNKFDDQKIDKINVTDGNPNIFNNLKTETISVIKKNIDDENDISNEVEKNSQVNKVEVNERPTVTTVEINKKERNVVVDTQDVPTLMDSDSEQRIQRKENVSLLVPTTTNENYGYNEGI